MTAGGLGFLLIYGLARGAVRGSQRLLGTLRRGDTGPPGNRQPERVTLGCLSNEEIDDVMSRWK